MLIVYSTINGLKTIESPRVSYPFRLRICARFPDPIVRASSHESEWAGWPDYRDQFRLNWIHMTGNFSPVSEMRKGRISLLRVLTRNAKKKANLAKKNPDLCAHHSVENTAGNARRCNPIRQSSSRFQFM